MASPSRLQASAINFASGAIEAGLHHCSAHGIRKFDATAAAENGATAHQLMAMFGWDSIKQAEHYTRKASQTEARERRHALARARRRRTNWRQRCPTSCGHVQKWDTQPKLTQSSQSVSANKLESGAQGRDRTTDTAIFSRMLYQLSYLGAPFRWRRAV